MESKTDPLGLKFILAGLPPPGRQARGFALLSDRPPPHLLPMPGMKAAITAVVKEVGRPILP